MRRMLAALLTSLMLCQDPAPAPTPAPAPAQGEQPKQGEPAEPPPVIETWNEKTAKAAVDTFAKEMKAATSMGERNKALDGIAGGSNKLLCKPLATVVETEKSVVIRKRAAELLANQPVADANPTIQKLLESARVTSNLPVTAALVRSLSNCGYASAQWPKIEGLFERDYSAERVPLQEELLKLVEKHKEEKALQLLLRNIDEPAPKNVEEGSNPPAEYWEARWKAWHAWRGKVKDALFAITGQRFSTSKEAQDWLKQNPRK
jgi:hypothetical protein